MRGELARSHIFEHTLGLTVSVLLMESSILSEVDDTSILRTGLSTRYWGPLARLRASRLLLPRSGLERSDFVPWPFATCCAAAQFRSQTGDSGHRAINSGTVFGRE